jgi:hypothetical protein
VDARHRCSREGDERLGGRRPRAFLASRSGRHFGDEVAKTICSGRDLPAAIDGVVERWMELRITPLIETEIGTPQGLPYLTGFVLMQEALLNRPP